MTREYSTYVANNKNYNLPSRHGEHFASRETPKNNPTNDELIYQILSPLLI